MRNIRDHALEKILHALLIFAFRRKRARQLLDCRKKLRQRAVFILRQPHRKISRRIGSDLLCRCQISPFLPPQKNKSSNDRKRTDTQRTDEHHTAGALHLIAQRRKKQRRSRSVMTDLFQKRSSRCRVPVFFSESLRHRRLRHTFCQKHRGHRFFARHKHFLCSLPKLPGKDRAQSQRQQQQATEKAKIPPIVPITEYRHTSSLHS